MLLEELKTIIKETVDTKELNEMNDLTKVKILEAADDFFEKNIRNIITDTDTQIEVETKMLNAALAEIFEESRGEIEAATKTECFNNVEKEIDRD